MAPRHISDFEGATIQSIETGRSGGEVILQTTSGLLKMAGGSDGEVTVYAGAYDRQPATVSIIKTALTNKRLIKVTHQGRNLVLEYEGGLVLDIEESNGEITYTLSRVFFEEVEV